MALKEMFRQETSFFDVELSSKTDVLAFLAQKFKQAEIVDDYDQFLKALQDREAQDSTGMGDGIAIPHALNPTVKQATLGFLRLKTPIDWQSLDNQPVDLIFLIATNGIDGNEHLTALSSLSSYLVKPEYQEKFRLAKNFKELQSILVESQPTKTGVDKVQTSSGYDVVGITACPTGIAHTYLAQEKILETAKQLNLTAKIETQGRRGIEDHLTADDIKNAKMIILAHDKELEGLDRFNDLEVIDTSTQDVIYHTKEILENYATKPKKVIKARKTGDSSNSGEMDLKKFKDFKGVLLAGVSRMLPFVVGGGIILGLAFLIDFIAAGGSPDPANMGNFGTINKGAGWFAAVGKIAMDMMVPVFAAYVAYALVGSQGLMPGMVGGLLANNSAFAYGNGNVGWVNLWGRLLPSDVATHSNSGFIGGIAAAFVAGLLVFGLTKGFANFKKGFMGVRDIVLIPLLSLLGVGVAMFALNIPLGYFMYGVQWVLQKMAEKNLLVLVGLFLGIMVCVDMGGPINKIAYVVGTLSIVSAENGGFANINPDTGNMTTAPIMSAVMLSGMMPPLAIAFSTLVFRKAWTEKQRDSAKANWVMGLSFVTEGAIPFMIDDYKRVNVSSMIGGGLVGILATALKIGIPAPHGGIFVSPLATSDLFSNNAAAKGFGIAMYILLPLIGMAIAGSIMGAWRSRDIKRGKLTLPQA